MDRILTRLPTLPQGVADAAAGYGDALLLYAPILVRNIQGIEDVVNRCSYQYSLGHQLGHLTQTLLLQNGVQRRGVLNVGQNLRIGFSRYGGRVVFRVTGKLLGGRKFDLYRGGPL